MVRVFSIFHYQEQNIHRISDNILASCLIDNNHLIVAKSNHIIEIISLDAQQQQQYNSTKATNENINSNNDENTATHSVGQTSKLSPPLQNESNVSTITTATFPTIDEVQQMIYCKQGNYIATIELKSGVNVNETTRGGGFGSGSKRRQQQNSINNKYFCRIYTNWWNNAKLCGYNTKIRARIANKVTPTTSTDSNSCLEIIEIPLKNTPNLIACCQITGNLIATINSTIIFYKLLQCHNESTKFKYIDFKEIPFAIDLEFTPKRIQITENIIGALNDEYVSVFKIIETDLLNMDDITSVADSLTSDVCGGGGGVNHNNNKNMPQNYYSNNNNNNYENNKIINFDKINLDEITEHISSNLDHLKTGRTTSTTTTAEQQSSDMFSVRETIDAIDYDCQIINNKLRNLSISDFRPIPINMAFNFRQTIVDNNNLIATTTTTIETPSATNVSASSIDNVNQIDDNIHGYSIKSLLNLKLRDISDPFKCLVLHPIYMKRSYNNNYDKENVGPCEGKEEDDNDDIVHDNNSVDCDDDNEASQQSQQHILKSKYSNEFIGITVLIATSTDGYLYQFTNNEKWITENQNYIATYPFTSTVIDVTMNNYILQVLTDRGMEIYTLRIGHKLFNNCYEYNLCDELYPIEACPRVEEPICLIGLRTFIGVKIMLSTDENLILFANSEKIDKEPLWTIYNLKLPSPERLYMDFEEFAKNHLYDNILTIQQQSSTTFLTNTYLNVMGEAHIIMRIAKEFLQFKHKQLNHRHQQQQQPQHKQKLILETDNSFNCTELFYKSCHKLGDFCVLSNIREEYCLAFPYYTMGKLTITEVYDRVIKLTKKLNRPLIGLVHTLKNMFIKLSCDADEIGRLLTTQRTTTINNVVNDDDDHGDDNDDANNNRNDGNGGKHLKTFGEELLDLFLINAPHEISTLTLSSQYFREFMIGKVCDAIQTKEHVTIEDKLCLILNAIRLNQFTVAHNLLIELQINDFYNLLVKYWVLLFDIIIIPKTGKTILQFSEFLELYLLTEEATIDDGSGLGGGGTGRVGVVQQNEGCDSNKFNSDKNLIIIRLLLIKLFKYLLIDTTLLKIDIFIKLFIDYLSKNIGSQTNHGCCYKNAQLILEKILELYFYNFYVIKNNERNNGNNNNFNNNNNNYYSNNNTINNNLKKVISSSSTCYCEQSIICDNLNQLQLAAKQTLNGGCSDANHININKNNKKFKKPSHGAVGAPSTKSTVSYSSSSGATTAATNSISSICDSIELSQKNDVKISINNKLINNYNQQQQQQQQKHQLYQQSNYQQYKYPNYPYYLISADASENFFCETILNDSMKILIRIYLGHLKNYQQQQQQQQQQINKPSTITTVTTTKNSQYINYMKMNLDKIYQHHKEFDNPKTQTNNGRYNDSDATTKSSTSKFLTSLLSTAKGMAAATTSAKVIKKYQKDVKTDRSSIGCAASEAHQQQSCINNKTEESNSDDNNVSENTIPSDVTVAAALLPCNDVTTPSFNNETIGNFNKKLLNNNILINNNNQLLLNNLNNNDVQQQQILYLSNRYAYLNQMEPFTDTEFKYYDNLCLTYNLLNINQWTEINLYIVKLQAILSSGKLSKDILQEIIYFMDANQTIIGIDSFITILLPTQECINFLINHYPQYLLGYAKVHLNEDKQWSELLVRFISKKSIIIEQKSIKHYEDLLKGMLNYIVKIKTVNQILNIFPPKLQLSKLNDDHLEEQKQQQFNLKSNDNKNVKIKHRNQDDSKNVNPNDVHVEDVYDDDDVADDGGDGDCDNDEKNNKNNTSEKDKNSFLAAVIAINNENNIDLISSKSTKTTGMDNGGGACGGEDGANFKLNCEEEKIFIYYFKKAIDTNRAQRLGDMIVTTGHQLHEAFLRNKQYFN